MSLRIEHLSLKLPTFTLSVNAEFTTPITGIFGPSGSGKTTFLEIISGLRRPDKGRIILHNRLLTDSEQKVHISPAKRHVGYVPQDLALFPHLDAAANLRYGLPAKSNNPPLLDRVIELLELSPLLKRSVHRLSGGEQQRIALGRALLAEPKILLLDEPLSSLDDRLKERILPYFKAIYQEFKTPMIYVTHSPWELTTICDQIIILRSGQIESS